MIAANLPDLDVLGLPFGHNLAWRRGWTHGPIADALLPPLLAGAMVAFDRWQARRGDRPAARNPVRFGWLLALAYVGLASHLLLDLANTYGIRLLMPFSDRWFYGDTLFIVDPWLWSALALGVWAARRRRRLGLIRPGLPAIAAMLLVAGYAALMNVGSAVARERAGGDARVVASPVPVDPFRRALVVADGGAYRLGEANLPGGEVTLGAPVPTNMIDPAIRQAATRDRRLRDFLYWSRLPFAEVRPRELILGDARYQDRPDGGRFTVRSPLP